MKAQHFPILSNGGNADFGSCCHSHTGLLKRSSSLPFSGRKLQKVFFPQVTSLCSSLLFVTELTVSTPGFLRTNKGETYKSDQQCVFLFCFVFVLHFEYALQYHSSCKSILSVPAVMAPMLLQSYTVSSEVEIRSRKCYAGVGQLQHLNAIQMPFLCS